jgi:hypothetical protein
MRKLMPTKTERIKRFVKHTVKKIVIFTLLMFVIAAIGQSISPIVTNEMALTQMQNSNEMYVLTDTYTRLRPIVNTIFNTIIYVFIGTIIHDIYDFVKINNEIDKEN